MQPSPKISSKFSSSSTSLNTDLLLTEEEKAIWNFAKTMLMGRLFIGTFQEKRYVEKLGSYRNVIVVSSSEVDLIKDMALVRKKLLKYYKSNVWIGITTPEIIGAPAGNCFWVELTEEVFGAYWYKIKAVRFRRNEILLRLKVIRPIKDEPSKVAPVTPGQNNTDDVSEMVKTTLTSAKQNLVECFKSFLSLLTFHNAKEAIKFVSVCVIALVTGLLQLSTHLSEFLLKMFNETNRFIYVSTPIALAVVNLIGKVIGGFYLLIAMMWKDWKHPHASKPPPQHLALEYNAKHLQNNPSLKYQSPGSWQHHQKY